MLVQLPDHFADRRRLFLKPRAEALRGFSGHLSSFIHPIAHGPLGDACKLRQTAHGPSGLDEMTKVAVNRYGAHNSYVLPIVGNVKERATWR